MLLALLVFVLATPPPLGCAERDWQAYGVTAPCADVDRKPPTAARFATAWGLSIEAARLAEKAWTNEGTPRAAKAWVAVAKAAPARFEPVAALAVRCWRYPDRQIVTAIEASEVPIENAKKILVGYRARQLLGAHAVIVSRWLIEQGPPGMRAVVDAGFEQTYVGLTIGLVGLAPWDVVKTAAAAAATAASANQMADLDLDRDLDLEVGWARETLRVALGMSLTHLATEIHDSLPPEARARLAREKGAGSDIRPAMAVALKAGGEIAEATTLVHAAATPWASRMVGPRGVCTDFDQLALHDLLPAHAPLDRFEARVSLRRCHPSSAALVLTLDRFPEDREILAERLSRQAARLTTPELDGRYQTIGEDDSFEREWRRVGAAARFERERYQRLSAESGSQEGSAEAIPQEFSASVFVERPWRAKLTKTATCPGLPVDSTRVTARMGKGGRCIAIAESQTLDPTGEVSGGGYWLFVTDDDGYSWKRGIYLGLRQFRPYEITPDGEISLADGVLHIQARRREIVESSIRFPPVGTQFSGQDRRIALEANYARLVLDSDGDGLTDLEEDRMMLDAQNPDSDGDGIPDGDDLWPNVPASVRPKPEAELMTAFLAVLAGEESPALITRPGQRGPSIPSIRMLGFEDFVFVEGDPAVFAGVRTSKRVVVLPPRQLRRARARFGSFYPRRIDVVVDGPGKKAFISWSAGWVGGSYEATRGDGAWTFKPLASWVT